MATNDTVLGHLQQPSQQSTDEPAQDACTCAERGTQAALSADRAPEYLTPEAAEQGLLMRSAPLSPLPEPPLGASAIPPELQDIMDLLLPPVLHTIGHNVPSQDLSRPRNASRATQSPGSAAAGTQQLSAEQQQGELPASSQQPAVQKPRPKPRARRAEAGTGPPISCMPAAAPGHELSPEHECVVCLDVQPCVMVAPCGHIPCCKECAEQLCGPDGIHALTRGQVCPL